MVTLGNATFTSLVWIVTYFRWNTQLLWLPSHRHTTESLQCHPRYRLSVCCFFITSPYKFSYPLFFFSDLWVADSHCTTGCTSVPTFDPSTSSTFQNQSTSFSITYGSGHAAGSLGEDVVQMAGYSVPNQIFAVCDQVSQGLLINPVSGLLGLAFQTIASSQAMPLWQTLVSGGAWDSPLMGFHLTRLVLF